MTDPLTEQVVATVGGQARGRALRRGAAAVPLAGLPAAGGARWRSTCSPPGCG